jgi:hypothetical protein
VIPDALELRRYLRGLDYPSDRAGVVEHARRRGATDDVLRHLKALPNRSYDGPDTLRTEYAKT